MKKSLIKTRKFNKEVYKVYLVEPSYEGEKGYCGMDIEPYVVIETPENCLGYSDYVFFDKKGYGHTNFRYIQPWIVRELEKINSDIMDKINSGLCVSVIQE